jgi:hypothetical protein
MTAPATPLPRRPRFYVQGDARKFRVEGPRDATVIARWIANPKYVVERPGKSWSPPMEPEEP